MKSAARLLPSLSQPLRSSSRPITRTILARSLAGPSTLPRTYATTSNVPPTSSPIQSEPVTDEIVRSILEGEREGEAEEEIPSNINFEELSEEADESIDRFLGEGNEFSSIPSQTSQFDPILLPISSLASSTPALPSESGLVVSLPPDIFAQPIRRDILHRCVVWYLSLLRSGTKTTKSRSTVNYSGRKLRPQKGTGRARVGDASSGTRRGGAPIHPIFPKDWTQKLPRKVRYLGLKIALSSKLNSGLLRVVQNLNEGEWKGTNEASRALSNEVVRTEKEVDLEPIITEGESQTQRQEAVEEGGEIQIINKFGTSKDLSILFVYSPDKLHNEGLWNFHRSIRNIPGVELVSTDELQVYHVLKYKWLVMEGGAIDALSGVRDLEEELELVPEQLNEAESVIV
ncbi:50S ribosomal protein L4 [Kwoniella bestiolae CBS 10118]|uniref:Large ribosomal subunit protein uL4m n=1 Tax=Kwoniella bestiolae CBS 10118 TaxID=1296100 RepID=A0A1B9FR48_9TREE|nr:50S ribosomal protein L4 [Kwoniella bestiolae CBS 10118]OCF21222.1 50S ribosomal protein L4 [Kwoniella bestiolae CBS 10118]